MATMLAHSWYIGGTTGLNGVSWQYRGENGWPKTLCGFGPSGFHFDYCGFEYGQAYLHSMIVKRLLGNKNPDAVILVNSPFPDSTGEREAMPSWTWPGFEKANMDVAVYATCQQVKLLLNGRDLGTKDASECVAHFSVPYAAGNLKAIGLKGGVQVAEYTLESASKPSSIRLSTDRRVINADNQDLCYVTAEVTDAGGIWIPYPILDASDPSHIRFGEKHLHFRIDGPGSILGIENGLSIDHESIRKPEHDTHLGRCLVAIRSSHTPGTTTLKASGDGLMHGKVTIISK